MDEQLLSIEKEKSIDKLVCNLIDQNKFSEQKIIKLQNEIKKLRNQNNVLINKNIALESKVSTLKFTLKKFKLGLLII